MKDNNPKMPIFFSLYLDVVRFIAALAVFIAHVGSPPFSNYYFWRPLSVFGDVAVIVFFILSGYVIAYVTSTREKSLFKYASARIARIYSVVIVALVITLIADNIGLRLNPDFYENRLRYFNSQSIQSYVSGFIFVSEYQMFHFNGAVPGTNAPYWSLSFEVTYYAIAGLFIFTRTRIAIPVIVVILLLAGKTIVALLPLWILGYALYFTTVKSMNKVFFYIGFVGSLSLLVITPYLATILVSDNFGNYFPWGQGPFNRNLTKDYLTALFFGVNIICARAIFQKVQVQPNEKTVTVIRWFGRLTFPLYLVHFPVLVFFSSISPWGSETMANVVFISLLTLVVVIVATPLSEILKTVIKNRLNMFKKKLPYSG